MVEFTPLPELALGPLTLNAHGIMIAVGLAVAYIVFSKITTDKRLLDIKDELLLVLAISGFLGARLLYVISNADFYAANPLDIVKFWEGGTAFSGALIFGAIGAYAYLKRKNIEFWKATDFFVIPIVAGIIVGRLGDFLSWDHPGTATELPWAFVVNGISQHPVILYEIIGLLAILALLYFISKKGLLARKQFLVFLGSYGTLRIITDFFRDEITYSGFKLAQIIGIALLLASIAAFFLLKRATKNLNTKKRG